MRLAAIPYALKSVEPREIVGTVRAVKGLVLTVEQLPLPVGSLVKVMVANRDEPPRGEVVGFDGTRALVMLLAEADGVASGVRVVGEQPFATVGVSEAWLGRVVDALGRPIDGKGPIAPGTPQPLWPSRTSPLSRGVVRDPLPTGVRAIDSMLTIGKGQRMGIFAGPGVGKSTLLGSIARGSNAHVNVIGLVGERGREVPEFIEHVLGEEGLKRSVVVVATGDESPLMRVRAATVACSVAEYFRDGGLDVMLMIDSVTRFAQAQRQIGLSAGEAPATKGFTPSVFAMLPRLLERAGAIAGGGSITGFYTVLVEGDDFTEPIADAAKGILDGHIVLTRRLAERAHFPAIDILSSISRVADQISDKNHIAARRHLSRMLAAYREAEELIQIGAYARGSNPDVDAAIALKPVIEAFLRQGTHERNEYPRTLRSLVELSLSAEGAGKQRPAQGASAAKVA
ncbi:MAG: FliI/YscN family ATPase [Planctomycetaceae bacterium]|jgi:flagellum-specific ATP synthase|nr:FliI/YscN family ATPase [Planctomycetaceae bacterium]